jgi:hypothetical protein
LQFAHPRTGDPLRFAAPIPDELGRFLAKLS